MVITNVGVFIDHSALFLRFPNWMFTDPPQVTLQLGNKLNPDTIKENDDVYFECNIRANPKKYKITWLHNVSTCIKHIASFSDCNGNTSLGDPTKWTPSASWEHNIRTAG